MPRLRNILFVSGLLWLVTAVTFNAVVSSKVRKELNEKLNTLVEIDKVKFPDYYLQNSSRTAEVLVSFNVYKDITQKAMGTTREERTLKVTTTGRWWPGEIHIEGNVSPSPNSMSPKEKPSDPGNPLNQNRAPKF